MFRSVACIEHGEWKGTLYFSFVKSETVKDCEYAIISIEKCWYFIHGLIIDGKQSLFKSFSEYHLQMCHFHMIQTANQGIKLL